MPVSTLRHSPVPPSHPRLSRLLWILFVWMTLSARAQNLVTNGGFFGGELTGWQGNPGYIGYVPSPGGAWIGLGGELYQDLATDPGAVYTIEFSVQRFDPQQSWRPNSLEVSWNNQRLAHFDFVDFDHRWIRPRFFVKATGTVTRLHFLGSQFPSLDNVTVTRLDGGFYSGAMAMPLEGFQSLEGDPIPLRSLWSSEGGAAIPSTTTFVLGGIVSLATAPQTGGEANAVWTNPPPGVHFLSGSAPGGYQTPPVRVVVATRPKLRQVTPSNRQVFAPGAPVRLGADLIDNTGTNAIGTVRIRIDGEAFARVSPTANRVEATWTATSEGSHTVEFIGETADGRDVARANVLIHVLPTGERDVLQLAEGGSESFSTAARIAQTFTAGVDGRLVAVELVGGSNSSRFDYSLRVEILGVDPVTRKPGTNVLGTTQLTLLEAFNASSVGMLHFAFPSNQVQLVSGRSYAVACRFIAPTGEEAYLRTSSSDAMPGGQLWRQSGANWIPMPFAGGAVIGHDIQMTTWMVAVAGPSVTMQSPTPLTSFAAGEAIPIRIEATPGHPSNGLERITFLANGLEIGSLTSPPYEFTWTNPPVGNHLLQATATDVIGRIGWSESISVFSGIDAAVLPRIRVADTVAPEGNSSLPPLVFPVTLSAPAASTVTVQFSTRNLTAIAGVDYLAASGTLSFAPGQTQAYAFVRMLGDSRDEPHRSLLLELRLAQGAILDRASAVGVLLDDEPGVHKASSYRWSELPSNVVPGAPFKARLTARDPFGSVVDGIPGGVAISAVSEMGDTRLFQGPTQPTSRTGSGGFTAGYRFRPKVDVLVTHLRAAGGSKVTIWTEQGRVEVSAAFPGNGGSWQEVPLPDAVLLKAGTYHRIALYAGLGSIPAGGAGVEGIDLIEPWGQYEGAGDAFPVQPSQLGPLVDFRFIRVEEKPDVLDAFTAADFPQGYWEGTLTLRSMAPRVRLLARDLLGNSGVSARLPLPQPSLSLSVDRTVPGAAFVFQVPGNYWFQVQASPDLQSWTNAGPPILSSGSPILWQPSAPLPPVEFFRLITVD